MFRFRCTRCDQWHEGIPGFAAEAPLYYHAIPAAEREARCVLTADTCVVDDTFFFVRGCIEIPVEGADEPFVWGVWASLSASNYAQFTAHLDRPGRERIGPYFGWLSAQFIGYPDAENLKTMVHPRALGMRPRIELEPTMHPLAVEQREGITSERLGEICAAYLHR